VSDVGEAPFRRTDQGREADGEGWFVLNAREAIWGESETMGVFTRLGEGESSRFPQVGFNIGVLWPGQPACMYHREPNQEDFLVVAGECVLLVEGQERQLKTWDFFHCPPDTDHVFVATGEGPCVAIAVGSRASRDVVYPQSELAKRYGAGVEKETTDPKEAYAGMDVRDVAYQDGWLPDF
jgi:uncharacterized cupin superfamily protein